MPALVTRLVGALALAAHTGSALRFASTGTPVQKVIDLLGDISKQVQEEGKNEAAQYDKYACFCKEQADEKAYAIAKSTDKIQALQAEIDLLTAAIADLDKEAGELGGEIETLKTDIENLEEARAEEHAEWQKADENVTGAINATEEAIEIMRASRDETKTAGEKVDLAQVANKLNRPQVVAMVAVLGLSQGEAGQLKALQEPKSYEYHSKDVIETLQDLLVQFKETKKRLYEAEFEKKSIAEKDILGKATERQFKEEDKAQKEALSDSKSSKKHDLEAEKDEETKAMNADTEFQTVLTTQCNERATEWDQRSKSRAGELTVIAEAIGILESGASEQYSANKKLVELRQVPAVAVAPHSAAVKPVAPRRASLIQLANAPAVKPVDTQQVAAERAVEHLDAAAKRLGSVALAAVVTKAALKEEPVDHFVKVRSIINDLIAKLEDEAEAEATQKSLCDEQVSAAVKTRDEQSSEVEKQAALVAENEAKIKQLTQEIAELSEGIASLTKALNDATELRAQEKAVNEKTIADAEEGKVALDGAIKILQDYYGASLVQVKSSTKYVPPNSDRDGKTVGDLAPEMAYSGEYKGKTEQSGGIIGLLQVIQADFQRTIDTTADAEKDAASKFTEFKTQTETDISAKEGEKETKEGEVTTAEEAVLTAKDDKNTAEKLHESSLEELEKLHAMCVAGAESYEERAAKREKEIEALKEAMDILENFNK